MEKSRLTLEEKQQVVRDFEGCMRKHKHKHCTCCRRIRLKHDINNQGVCVSCKKFKDPKYFLRNKGLPVWYEGRDNKKSPNYHVPSELQNLTLSERMLIQRVSPFLALQHMKNGVMGLKGHAFAFEQKIRSLATILPRPVSDVNVIRVEQLVRSEIGSDVFHRKAFKVRRSKVITALYWLKQHNPEYADIEIDESNLEWIGESDAGYIDVKVIVVEHGDDDNNNTNDIGPVPDLINRENTIPATGLVDNGDNAQMSEDDQEIAAELQDTIDNSQNKRGITTTWPALEEKAVNEFSDVKVFARSFPWLFPGGLGDPKDFPQSLGEWGSLMIFYEDARFAQDKIFVFYALNYIIRHRNATSGSFFIDKFQQNCPETLDDLKDKIQKGDTSFVNSLTYYNKGVKGSNSYWAHKRSEVYAWMNHHVEVGNGAPMFFITLSCAEHYWADVAMLLKHRLDQAGLDSSKCKVR